MTTDAWKRERHDYLKQWVPILERIKNKFPTRRASFEDIEKATGVKFQPDIWNVVNELQFEGGHSNGVFEWTPNCEQRIEFLKADLKQLKAELDSKSWTKRLNSSSKIWDIIKIGISALVGYLIGKYG